MLRWQSSILGERYRALDDEAKKRYTDAAREALEKFKAEHPDLPRGARKKKTKAESAKEDWEAAVTEDETGEASGLEEEEADPPTNVKKKRKKKKEAANDKDGSEENDDEEPAKPKPKLPLNAYILFVKDARPRIAKGNPGLTVSELVRGRLLQIGLASCVEQTQPCFLSLNQSSKVGKEWKELSEDERRPYNDKAAVAKEEWNAAMTTFREEHGEDASKAAAKKKRKKSKAAAKAEFDSDTETDDEEPATAKPKRPLNGYMIFMKKSLPEIKAEHPDLPQKEVVSERCAVLFPATFQWLSSQPIWITFVRWAKPPKRTGI